MKKTKHALQRMQQRGINPEMILLANLFGEPSKEGEKVILNKKTIDKIIKNLQSVSRRGGLTLVEDSECLITTYFNNSFNRKLSHN